MILLIPCKSCGGKPERMRVDKPTGQGQYYAVGCHCGQVVMAATEDRAAEEWNKANRQNEPGHRHERCEQCGERWNLSPGAKYYAGVYVCPKCEQKNRKAAGL